MNRILALRTARGWSQEELAGKINVKANAISRYENGVRGIDIEKIIALRDVFGVTVDYLLGLSESPYAAISDADARLLNAYHDASEKDRKTVDHVLAEYMTAADDEKKMA